jgi:hypothetical protein
MFMCSVYLKKERLRVELFKVLPLVVVELLPLVVVELLLLVVVELLLLVVLLLYRVEELQVKQVVLTLVHRNIRRRE